MLRPDPASDQPIAAVLSGGEAEFTGPMFYRQERVGWNGKPFMMFKFRSMPVHVEKNGVQWGGARNKAATPFGAFLRKTSLDELPQFINVLKGDMSIVGPRPSVPCSSRNSRTKFPTT